MIKCKILITIIVIFLFIIFFYFFFINAPRNFPVGKIITIEPGINLRALSKDFKNQELIHSSIVFETFFNILGNDRKIIPGDYLIEKRLSVFGLIKKIANPKKNLAQVKITIPEGLNNEEISLLISSRLKNFNKDKFLSLAEKNTGYLFPDTYFFSITDNEEKVLNFMISNFNKKTDSLRLQIESEIESKKLDKLDTISNQKLLFKNFREIIIMASIIEEEAKGDNDREIISGILLRRLSINMPLQADAAPETYKILGLPIKPLSNPGLKSIEAAIYPKESPYIYYLHDANMEVHYAKTYEEHLINKKKYLKNREL